MLPHHLYNGLILRPTKLLPPDFYVIVDWENPSNGAIPEWHCGYIMEGVFFAHPSLIDRILSGPLET